jgi:hypothetical protein
MSDEPVGRSLAQDCQGRVVKLQTRIDALIAEEATLSQRPLKAFQTPIAIDVAEWASSGISCGLGRSSGARRYSGCS